MANFFPMQRGDIVYLAAVIGFAVVSFLPWTRDIYLGGMALQGWLMAALMVLAPAIALLRMAQARRQEQEAARKVDDGGAP